MTQPIQTPSAPLFRDPIFDGAADPTLIWNTVEKQWWIIYTNRRANIKCEGVSWVHGTDLGIASSSDHGQTWTYRGTIEGLDFERGRNTFWAPEVFYHNGLYHMYVSYIQGVPNQWSGHKRQIVHYTSGNLWDWSFQSILKLSSEFVIDACVHPLENGKFRMWYKDEKHHSHTYAADSNDLYDWEVVGPVITDFPHEGANVFRFEGSYWMVVDKWAGQAVYQSNDLETWTYNNSVFADVGMREDDQTIGLHADVHISDDAAYIIYFTHPQRSEEVDPQSYESKRTSIQVAKLEMKDHLLICNRNKPFSFYLT
ncbi:glycosyl hydrolase [Alkalihalobacillus trypoxylicola]|uniref:Glycosyl hydrolase n=1 Tax=Alkalihalobacillus trypoxylicola TaxID=519424 RepID=A0A162DGA9_9BACI|nr:glycosyl hydrolase [Alkalihalobacillus trypoxylicola]KYG29534.1 glycosyl hydrolase [Alkalihalobacillus trypoxylicola]